MEKIRKFRFIVLLVLLLPAACTKYQYEDTGLSRGNFNCSMWEYLCSDSSNWHYTVQMIKHAGMEEIFKGNSEYGQITFFGVKNIPIYSYLLEKKLKSVTELDPAFCRTVLERLIVPGRRVMRDEVLRGNSYDKADDNTEQTVTVREGGEIVDCISGQIWIYSYREPYNNVPETGEVALYMMSKNIPPLNPTRVVTTNLQTLTGVVQALSEKFKLTQI